jgi:hypothetical protein
MGSVKTSTDILTSVKRRAMLPQDDATFSSTDLLEILNEELNLGLLSTIMKVHEEFYVHSYEHTLTSGTSNYAIPARAVGNKLRNARLKDAAGNYDRLTRIQPEQVADYGYSSSAFTLQNDELLFVNDPQSGTLVMDIYLRPNQLVATSRGATVSSVDTTTGVVTFTTTLPSHFAADLEYDFVSHNSPCKIMAFDKTASAIDESSYTLTFTASDLPSGLAAGDYVTVAEETIVPQMPVEMVPILCQRAACHCLEAIGDIESLNVAQQKLQLMEQSIITLIDNRCEGTPQKVVNPNSYLRRKKYSYYG